MKWLTVIIPLLFALILTGCSQTKLPTETLSGIPTGTPSAAATTVIPNAPASEKPSPSSAAIAVPDFEVELVAKTLRGECFDEQHDDKREVVKVICNRVSHGEFGDSIEAVITAPRQFQGYRTGNIPTANDYEIAREVLAEWYEGGCRPMGEYLFFSSGNGHKNVFRENY